ncbi:MAG: TraB/GumN family protein [Gammaproteobacteria bacterium]
MKRTLFIKLSLLLLSFFVFTCAHSANDKAFVWEVRSDQDPSNQAVVYLMGSIHFADKSFYPLRPEIEEAFARSQYLVVELDIYKTDHQAYARLLSQRGVYKDGTTIKDIISNETWLQLRQHLRLLNIDYEGVKNYKPGILVLTLSAAQVMQMGFDAQLGIDVYFLTKASQSGQLNPESLKHGQPKKILELETLEQQLNLFLNIPNGDLLLKESLYSLDEAELLMADVVRYWKQGDEKQMNKLLFEDALNDYPEFSEIYDSLFYDRNKKMTIKIDEMLKQKQGSYFVVVGSGHLIGEKGIVNALKGKGYKVKRL